ncbi:MAG: MgtC/SapB family protein [Planctomycetes bacterium]|nr:MgtC/SapB family protein [Planctomycetota bacterium]
MGDIWPYLGDLHRVLDPHWSGVVLVLCSLFCGMVVGAERQFKQKPAGLRTLTLICVGSTVFTLASILIAGEAADRTRIAAQVVTGVGFLGAGAIIRDRGMVIGLTTGASIWSVAAIGVLVGGGYAAAGIVLTLVIASMLSVVRLLERRLWGRCRYAHCRVYYRPEHGRTHLKILRVLDQYRIPDHAWDVTTVGELEAMDLRYCHFHWMHRALLFDLVDISGVTEIQRERAPRQRDDTETNGT